jgi:hypothetical protein
MTTIEFKDASDAELQILANQEGLDERFSFIANETINPSQRAKIVDAFLAKGFSEIKLTERITDCFALVGFDDIQLV